MTGSDVRDPRLLRRALGAFATGVTIVTAHHDHDVGLTANSFNSVSLDPPMVLWSLARSSPNLGVFEAASHFAVHVLSADQQELSDRFARSGQDKFEGLAVGRGRGNVALLEACSARFECRQVFRYEGGDHVIFVGEVEDYATVDKRPLVYHGGEYGVVVPRRGVPALASETREARQDLLTYLLFKASDLASRPVRALFLAHGLTEDEHYVLILLLRHPGCDATTLRGLFEASGRRAAGAPESGLVERGMIEPPAAGAEPDLRLTETGRRLAVTSLAAAKSVESDLLDGLDEGEALMLRQLLRRVIGIAGTDEQPGWSVSA